MMKNALIAILFMLCWLGAYMLGRSHSEVKIVKEQVEVVKYVEKVRADIYSRPNANRDELLKLMRQNVL